MLYFHDHAASITLHPAAEYIHLRWGADQYTDLICQEVMNKVLVALQAQQWQKLLVSQMAPVPFSVELQVWLQLDWRPRAVQAGYRYAALVPSRELLSQMALVDALNTNTNLWPRYYCCADEQAAQVWLAEQPRVA